MTSKTMSAKTQLLEMFDADIAKATGYDKQDLQVVRDWIDRTPDQSEKAAFMAAMKAGQTLAERDAYIRATEWKRRQTR